MRTWKHADWIIQCILVIAGVIITLLQFDIWGYLIVGGWQMLSCLVNLVWRKGQWKVADRIKYLWSVFILICISILLYFGESTFESFILQYLFGLLFLTPIMAIWDISIWYREWKLIRTKDFMHLK